MRNINLSLSLSLSLSRCRVFLLIISLMCALQVHGQEREVACVYKEDCCASTNRGTSKMLAPARGGWMSWGIPSLKAVLHRANNN